MCYHWDAFHVEREVAREGDISFVVSLNRLSNKQSYCRWFVLIMVHYSLQFGVMMLMSNRPIPRTFITNGIIDFRTPKHATKRHVHINNITPLLITIDIHVGAVILLVIWNVSQYSQVPRDFDGHFGWRHTWLILMVLLYLHIQVVDNWSAGFSCWSRIQYSALFTPANIVCYCTNDCKNWGRISIRLWTHKRHRIPRPNGRAMRCLLRIFVRKLTAL